MAMGRTEQCVRVRERTVVNVGRRNSSVFYSDKRRMTISASTTTVLRKRN
jgi:hypothetical protein